MENHEAAQKALDTRIEQVDDEIAQLLSQVALLEAERVELKGQRNALAPIARLPPELLIKIFSSYVTHLDHSDLMHFGDYDTFIAYEFFQDDHAGPAVYQKLLLPDIFTVCHVSRSWRQVGVGCQSLWNHIQIQVRTSAELLRFMWSNSGDLPIRLDLAGTREDRLAFPAHAFSTFTLVQTLLKTSIGRFRSVGIYYHAPTLLDVLRGRSEILESLVAVEDHFTGRFVDRKLYDQVLSGGTPNLRHIDLTSLTIPWSSSLLSSSHLTHIALDYTLRPSQDSIAELIAFLRPISRLLETIKLALDFPMEDEEMEFFLARAADRTPIELPSLKVLHLDGSHCGPFTAILSLLHIPKDMLSVKLATGDGDDDLAEAILDFARCRRSPVDYISPEEVEIGNGSAICWHKQQFKWPDSLNGELSRQTLEIECKPKWMEIAVSWLGEANSTAFRLPWSFSHLRSISILRSDVTDDFWTVLAASSTLEVIRVDTSGERSFFQVLSEGYSRMDKGSPATLGTEAIPHVPLHQANGPQTVAFPALKSIWFQSFHAGASSESAMAFVKQIVAALRRRGSVIPLEEMRFEQCGSLLLTAEELDMLFTTTRCVVWEKHAGEGGISVHRPVEGNLILS